MSNYNPIESQFSPFFWDYRFNRPPGGQFKQTNWRFELVVFGWRSLLGLEWTSIFDEHEKVGHTNYTVKLLWWLRWDWKHDWH